MSLASAISASKSAIDFCDAFTTSSTTPIAAPTAIMPSTHGFSDAKLSAAEAFLMALIAATTPHSAAAAPPAVTTARPKSVSSSSTSPITPSSAPFMASVSTRWLTNSVQLAVSCLLLASQLSR